MYFRMSYSKVLLFTVLFGIIYFTLAQIERKTEPSIDKLKVSVYYETLCPDSKRLITRHIHPFLTGIGSDHVDVEFIPYGKATTRRHGANYLFSCQHGPSECKGNRMHACAIKYLPKTDQFRFIGCSMGKSNPPESLEQCASEIGLDRFTVNQISSCSNNAEGDKLLSSYGELTNSLQPKLFFVPTLTFNGVFNENNMWRSQNDFVGVVCSELKLKPTFCT